MEVTTEDAFEHMAGRREEGIPQIDWLMKQVELLCCSTNGIGYEEVLLPFAAKGFEMLSRRT